MKEDNYDDNLAYYFPDKKPDLSLDRREFLKLTGGGITIFFTVGDLFADQQRRRRGRSYPEDFNAYLRIHEDGRISCFTGKIEMGQGIITSFAQMLAEELDVALGTVDMVMGDTTLCPYDGSTTGSRSTKFFGPPLRKAAAEAKMVLIKLAAEVLKIPEEQLITKDGIVLDKNNRANKVSYAQLAKGKKMANYPDLKVSNKPFNEHTVSGKATLRSDSMAKITGEAKFTADIILPGMLYAKILRPPAHGAKLIDVDLTAAEKIAGVKVVRDGDLIAVLHKNPDIAERALWEIKAKFEEQDPQVNNSTIFKHLEQVAGSGSVSSENGDLKAGKKLAQKSFESTYYNHYVAHAPMEPHAAVVHIDKDEVKVWATSQAPFRIRDSVAGTIGVPSEKVRVFPIMIGGGFGGKKWNKQEVEAAKLAKLTGQPVQVGWTRKEEFFYNSFRPAAVLKSKSGVDNNGKIVHWDFDILFAGTRSSQPVYNIPNYRVRSFRGQREGPQAHPFNVGAWRGPGSNTNVFGMESQIDIMAEGAGMDPLSFRIKNLTDKRMLRVLKAAADKFGNSFSKTPSGKGYGIALTDYLGTYLAAMAEVKVDKNSGDVQVVRVVCAQDLGEIINPEGIKIQLEGCITMGLGYCFTEEILFKGGCVLNENFDTYDIARFSWLPKIEMVLINNPEMAPQGCGEGGITFMGGVMANAVYDAIGVRLFVLPMTPDRIKAALKKG